VKPNAKSEGYEVMRGVKRALSIISVVAATGAAAGCQSHGASGSGDDSLNRLTIMVGAAPGGSEDTVARMLQPDLQETVGATVVVDNQDGADGNSAAATTLSKGKDCSYLYLLNIPKFLTASEEEGVPFHSSDFVPLAQAQEDYGVLLVQKNSKWKTLKELLADAKANPGKISVSVQSVDSSNGEGLKDLEKSAGVTFNIVPFGGSGSKARTALLGGQVDVNASNVFNSQDIADRTEFLGVFQPENKWKNITNDAPTVSSVVGSPVPDVSSMYGLGAAKECQTSHPTLYKRLEKSALDAASSKSYKDALAKTHQEQTGVSVPADQFRNKINEQAKRFGVPPVG
jgi:tripartite-type tricarboxylate transporter receptor subunit TctC